MGVLCQIILQKTNEGVYRAGQPVVGTVHCSIDIPTKFGSIDLHFIGKGACEWSEKGSDDNRRYYKNEEEYVKQYRNLFITKDEQNVLYGTFEYPFKFLLPDDIPTSIKNLTCAIEYNVIVTFMKENFYETAYKFVEEVPVYGFVNPCSPEPLIFGLQKEVFSLKPNNVINVKAEIDKTFLTPGENITLKLAINNDSDAPITIKTELVKFFTYVADNTLAKTYERESLKTTKSYSPIIKEKSVSNLIFIVPTLPSLYSIQHSKILIGEYKVRVTAKVPFPHINATVEVTVVIGERRGHLGVAAVGIDDNCPPPYSELVKEDEQNKDTENVGDSFEK